MVAVYIALAAAAAVATPTYAAGRDEEWASRKLQAASMVGGRPPRGVELDLCSLQDVFADLQEIKQNADCMSGCAGGSGVCPADWYPGEVDECSALCGAVFEPFWVRATRLR